MVNHLGIRLLKRDGRTSREEEREKRRMKENANDSTITEEILTCPPPPPTIPPPPAASTAGPYHHPTIQKAVFVCAEVLRPSQPNEVMLSMVSLPNHTSFYWAGLVGSG